MRRSSTALLLALSTVLAGLPTASGAVPEGSEQTVPVGTWPLRPDPPVVHDFDPPASTYGAGHRGVDLLGEPGQVVRAALAGTVTYAGPLAGRGVVVVAHGSTRTTYEPVESSVEVGQDVDLGDRLGTLQVAPSHCAPRTCLHWGWIEGETYLDPLHLVGLGPVRLLPYLAEGGTGATATRSSAGVPVAGWRPPVATPPVPLWW